MSGLFTFFNKVFYSFPIQLLLNQFKRSQLMIFGWVVLLAMVTGSFGKYLGIPYLFLDPEYLDHVDFLSFFILGLVTAGYAAAYNITGYITEGHSFAFVGALARPFTKFALNNSILPLIFISVFVFEVVAFQVNNEFAGIQELFFRLGGFFCGLFLLTALLYTYFYFTQKDIFKYVVCKLDEKLKKNVRLTRASAMRKLTIARKSQVRVDYYFDYDLRFKKVRDEKNFYDRKTIIQVFDQNHFNLVAIELTLFGLILLLGIFKDIPLFQIPAAATFMMFLTVFVMISGAFSYWFGNWSGTAGLVLFLFVNHLVGEDYFARKYEAFGLNYEKPAASYTIENLKNINDSSAIAADRTLTLQQLNNWKAQFPPGEKPKMVFVCVSGGGKRAALWTLSTLQLADSLSNGKLMKHTVLLTGASGGLIGASYFRELVHRKNLGEEVNPYSASHKDKIASDNLNPLIFSLLANDLFVGLTKFEYAGKTYHRDRAFTFEDQLNKITEGYMDKPLSAYRDAELSGKIPLLLLSPTIINDGRKLYIASRPVSFLNEEMNSLPDYDNIKLGGVDFNRLFADHDAGNLRFLSALRMSATFPYITPNTTLPTNPALLIMDAGISDNFGLSDAARYLYSLRTWIAENTSGVVFVSIRDSPKIRETHSSTGKTIVDELTQPISSVYNNFENFQDINSDLLIGNASAWFNNKIDRVDIQYQPIDYLPILQKMDSIRQNSARASLSWRLTTREKKGIVSNLLIPVNQAEIERLLKLLN